MDKQEQISKEMQKLNKPFVEVGKDRKTLADKLVREVAFMTVTIQELQETINRDGPITYGTNGNGFEVRQEHPAQKSYNTMIKKYLAAMKQLNELLPDIKTEGGEKAGEAVKDFIRAGKK